VLCYLTVNKVVYIYGHTRFAGTVIVMYRLPSWRLDGSAAVHIGVASYEAVKHVPLQLPTV